MTGNPSEATIRDAGPLDAALFAVLHAACFPDEAWPETAVAALMAQPGSFAVLAAQGSEPLGFALGRRAGPLAQTADVAGLGEGEQRENGEAQERGQASVSANLFDHLQVAARGYSS